MKRYKLPVIAMVASLNLMADEMPDTVMAVTSPSRVMIYESPNGLNVTVEERDTVYEYGREYSPEARISTTQQWTTGAGTPFCTQVGDRDDLSVGGFNFAFIHPSGAQDWGIETGKSFEVTIENFLAYRRIVPMKGDWSGYLSVGIGGNWRFYTISRDTRFLVDEAGNVGLATYPEDVNHHNSSIRTFSLQFPITWTQQFPGRIFGAKPSLTLGAVLNWNTNAWVKTGWEDASGSNASATQRGLHQRKFTVDLMAKVRVCPFASLFVRYSPMSIFKAGHGPEVRPLTFGISIL